jgi:hypothetical protein
MAIDSAVSQTAVAAWLNRWVPAKVAPIPGDPINAVLVVRMHSPPAASLLRTPALGDGVRGSTAEGSRRGDKDDQAATRSSHGVGTPIDFNRACARAARAFIPPRCVLTSFPGRFSTLHPSCQYPRSAPRSPPIPERVCRVHCIR